MVRNEKGVWYFTYITECPVCGRGRVEKERRPAPKPEGNRWTDRYEYIEHYDWCEL